MRCLGVMRRMTGSHRPSEEYLIFVGIRAATTSFSSFTLEQATRDEWGEIPASNEACHVEQASNDASGVRCKTC